MTTGTFAAAADGTRPVLVVGPPRCSQTLLAVALAQHRSLDLVADTSPLVEAGYAATAASHPGTEVLADVGAAARAAAGSGQQRRWVGAFTVTSVDDVIVIADMFPTAQLIHVVRHPDAAAASLATKACGDGRYATRPSAYRAWLAGTDALQLAEAAYGTERVTRVTAASLRSEPAGATAACLDLVGLDADPLCAAPFRGLDGDDLTSGDDTDDGDSCDQRARAVARYAELTGRAQARHPFNGAALTARRDAMPSQDRVGRDSHARYRDFVTRSVPAGARIAVISKGDPALVDVPGRTCTHLPAGSDGRYLGYHPATGADARAHVRAAIAAGATHLVVPGASHWWLKHYPALSDLLDEHAHVVAHHADIATTYALPSRAPGAPHRAQALPTEAPHG